MLSILTRRASEGALLLVFLFCSSAAAQDDPPKKDLIRVGSKAFTENVILGEMLVELARLKGHAVQNTSELGTSYAFNGLRGGSLDVYPEYTGTIRREIFKDRMIRSDKDLEDALAAEGLRMSKPLGFVNSYAIGMKRELAEKLKIKTISDLARKDDPAIVKLRFGFSNEFEDRDDGWPKLSARYELSQTARVMDHNLAYKGINEGKIDVTDLFSTDAEIERYDLVVLEDNLGYFPIYDAVLLYRIDLEERAPEVVESIKRLEGAIDNETMIEMNARVLSDGQMESHAAIDFLNRKFDLKIPPPKDNRFQRTMSRLWRNTWQHLLLVSVSLLVAILVAIPLGIAAGKSRFVGQPILAAIGIVQTIPSLAVISFMVPLFGIGPLPAMVALFLYSLLPIVRGVYAGLKEISPNLRESALVLGLPPMTRLRQIELPLASRSILSGIKVAAVINVGTATIGGLIGAGGYGEPIMTGLRLSNNSLLLQGAIPAAILALAVQGLFEFSERWFVPAGLRK